ncbi:MAG: DNA alkylation repair protein [Planctomycetes bacterium]|nr:DNA alkylation repair protein [Planctomycetota bacterium]
MAAKASKTPAKTKPKATKAATPAKAPRAAKAKAPAARMSLAEAMSALERAGTAQTRKTWLRHGAQEPLFGVLFSEFARLTKRIGVDHDLACALWATRNADARILAVKIADPAKVSAADLDRWACDVGWPMLADYVAQLASEGPHARALADAWTPLGDEPRGRAGWTLVGVMALRDTATPDAWFESRLAEIEARIRSAPNSLRAAMNHALISIGGRSPALRDAALAAAKRLGKVEVDHGDTSCKTPDAKPYIEKMWAHAKAKGFATPGAQEQARESPRCRC